MSYFKQWISDPDGNQWRNTGFELYDGQTGPIGPLQTMPSNKNRTWILSSVCKTFSGMNMLGQKSLKN
jgi:hypothetical protein